MAILDIFKRNDKKSVESNSLFGQTALGNNIVYQGNGQNPNVNTQILFVTTGATNSAGRRVDMSLLSKNSTIISCVATKSLALIQLPIILVIQTDD